MSNIIDKAARKIFRMPQDAVEGTVGKLGIKSGSKRVVFVGTRASGKTTALGCIALTCDLLSQRQPNFSHFIHERTSGIRQIPSDLCMGRFPEPTPPGLVYEADIHLRWRYPFGERNVVMPFAETAGEDIKNLMGKYTTDVYSQDMTWQDAQTLERIICNSHGYILVLPTPRAHVPGVPQMDAEPTDVHMDPDLNAARILDKIYHWKQTTSSPPIEGIGVLWTKYDMVKPYCDAKGMSLYTQEGALKFMQTYFRQTTGLLKYYGLEKVRFFPFHVQVKQRQLANGRVEFVKDKMGYEIAVDYSRNLPVYSEKSCYDLIEWIRATFAG